ncbi:MAG TPA: hypothetical protein HA362_07265 [Nanoarchaeota archaeon]|nr:hypothetical protein [Nanoarchaeota archaeon]
MRASALEIDEKGIIAQDADSEDDYINLGQLILETSANFVINDGIRELFLDEGITANTAFRMPPPVAMRLKHIFKTDLSWVVVVPGTYKEPWPTGLATRVPCAIEGRELEMPIIFYFCGGDMMIFHEGIHIMRSFFNLQDRAFQEAFAKYGIPNPTHKLVADGLMRSRTRVIDTARKKLEDHVGDNARYALSRLSRDEIYNVCYAPAAFSYVKSLDSLRHRIVKERLGI